MIRGDGTEGGERGKEGEERKIVADGTDLVEGSIRGPRGPKKIRCTALFDSEQQEREVFPTFGFPDFVIDPPAVLDQYEVVRGSIIQAATEFSVWRQLFHLFHLLHSVCTALMIMMVMM